MIVTIGHIHILYLLDVFINFNYVIVTIVRWSLRCQNDYPLGLGSLKPDPSACFTNIQTLGVELISMMFTVWSDPGWSGIPFGLGYCVVINSMFCVTMWSETWSAVRPDFLK